MIKNFDKEMATKKRAYQKRTTDYGMRRGSGVNKEPFFEPLNGHGHNLTGAPEHGK